MFAPSRIQAYAMLLTLLAAGPALAQGAHGPHPLWRV